MGSAGFYGHGLVVTQVVGVDRSFKDKGAMMVKFRQLCTYVFVYLKPVHVLTFEQTLKILAEAIILLFSCLGWSSLY